MSDLYPEEAKLLTPDNLFAKYTNEFVKGAVGFIQEGLSKAGIAKNISDLVPLELNDEGSRQAVDRLKNQYAKHDSRFNEMSTEKFLGAVVYQDQYKIHTLADLDKTISGRLNESIQREEQNGYETQTIYNALLRFDPVGERLKHFGGKLSVTFYKGFFAGAHLFEDQNIPKLDGDTRSALMDRFNDNFKIQLQNYPRDEVYKAINDVFKDKPDISNSWPHEFTDALNEKLALNHKNIEDQKQADKSRYLDDLSAAGLDLKDPKVREAVSHATAAMGHTELNISPDDLQNSPHAKRVMDQFKEDFKKEIEANNGDAGKVIAAINAEYADPKGEANGSKKVSPEQFRANVAAEMTIQESGVNLDYQWQRDALARALNVEQYNPYDPKNRTIPNHTEDAFKNESLQQRANDINDFTTAYASEIRAAKEKGGAATVLGAIAKVKPNEVQKKSDDQAGIAEARNEYHKAVSNVIAGEEPFPKDKAKSEPQPQPQPQHPDKADNVPPAVIAKPSSTQASAANADRPLTEAQQVLYKDLLKESELLNGNFDKYTSLKESNPGTAKKYLEEAMREAVLINAESRVLNISAEKYSTLQPDEQKVLADPAKTRQYLQEAKANLAHLDMKHLKEELRQYVPNLSLDLSRLSDDAKVKNTKSISV